jgi:PAS domain-containing protein
MWTTDLESGVTHASDIDAALFGFEARARSFTHDEWLALVYPDDRELVLGAWQAARERNLPYLAEYRIVRPDGRVRWIYSCGRIELEPDGRACRTGGISMDITGRKEAERARAHIASALQRTEEEIARIVSLAPVGLIVARDTSCTVISSNPYAEQLFGVEPGSNISLTSPDGPLKGQSFRRNGEPIALEDLPLRVAARTGQSVRNDLLQFHAPGKPPLEVIISAEPLLDDAGSPRGAIATLQDVTALRSMELALRSSGSASGWRRTLHWWRSQSSTHAAKVSAMDRCSRCAFRSNRGRASK